MKPDIDRLDKEGIVTFCAFSPNGRDWMQREYPENYNALYQAVIFRVPAHRLESEDFIDKAKKSGLIIRFLDE